MSRRPVPAEPMSALSIPKELWYPTPVHDEGVRRASRGVELVHLLPVARSSGCSSVLAARAARGSLGAGTARRGSSELGCVPALRRRLGRCYLPVGAPGDDRCD